ncbi:S-layer homology domain-containing protein [Paenibacillus sp. FSL W8-1187]|uniref:S-layer homology domain-containing protein n=1 Tax=Paenibacillus sp. FSL W8-1187 TaxID=2975339 RepID=UPI0030DBE9EE
MLLVKALFNRAVLAALLAVALIVPAVPAGTASAAADTSAVLRQAGDALLSSGIRSDWDAIAASQAGYELPASYLSKLSDAVRKDAPAFRNVTDFERTALAVTAAGQDATAYGGIDLIERITSSDRMLSQGINGPIYALLALDYGEYEVPAGAKWSRDKLVAELLKAQAADGSYAFAGEKAGSPDLTGAALTALAPYVGQPEVKQAGERAVAWIKSQQDKDGGFTSYGESSSESVAQIVIGLASIGYDPAGADFTRDGASLIDKLLTFRGADGSFSHALPLAPNAYGAYQSVQALVAYEKFKAGTGRLYSKPAASVSVRVEGPSSTIGSGVTRAVYALDALTQVGAAKKLDVVVKEMSFGKYVDAIGGIAGGTFGGYDGWMYAVERRGAWINPSVGMGDFKLSAGDRLVVFYGDGTKLISRIAAEPRQPRDDEPFAVQVSQQEWDYTANAFTVTPAVGVAVSAGSVTVTTDAYGNASFPALPAGSYELTVTGYSPSKAPSVLKHAVPLTVGSTKIKFADEKKIAPWALKSVKDGYASGLLSGTGTGEAPTFSPKDRLTRAQFAALAVRLLGLDAGFDAAAPSFSDVKAGSWYEGAVRAAAAQGIVSGTGDGKFQPDAPVTRQDMAVILARVLKLDATAAGDGSIRDLAAASAYARGSIAAVHASGLMVGDSAGSFQPKAQVSREMAAVAIVNAYESLK